MHLWTDRHISQFRQCFSDGILLGCGARRIREILRLRHHDFPPISPGRSRTLIPVIDGAACNGACQSLLELPTPMENFSEGFHIALSVTHHSL